MSCTARDDTQCQWYKFREWQQKQARLLARAASGILSRTESAQNKKLGLPWTKRPPFFLVGWSLRVDNYQKRHRKRVEIFKAAAIEVIVVAGVEIWYPTNRSSEERKARWQPEKVDTGGQGCRSETGDILCRDGGGGERASVVWRLFWCILVVVVVVRSRSKEWK